MSDYKKYTVTAKSPELSIDILHDLVIDGVRSETVPDRGVEVSDLRYINAYNTEYLLSDEEAEALRQDNRVESVEAIEEVPIAINAFQSGNFTKSPGSGEVFNWGLIRHTNSTNVYESGSSSDGMTYDYVLDGTGVDVVIIDTGIQADHPEFLDDNGNSRVRQIDWFSASGVSGSMPSNHYTDFQGHGTHVASTVAGKTFGWARNADIYSIKILKSALDPNAVISVSNALDCVLGWHLNKTNKRPTVVNNSWGYIIFNRAFEKGFSFSQAGGTLYPVNGGVYRGQSWTGGSLDSTKGHSSSDRYGYPINSVDVDISQLSDAGVFVCNSAGNSSLKLDINGGNDFNNTINLSGLGNLFYHRPGSPKVINGVGFQVGSMGTGVTSGNDNKSSFSNSGPAVGVYSAGSSVVGAMSNVNEYISSSYHANSSFKQGVLSGTSMASPQIAGIAALILQAYPNWTPAQVYSYIVNNSTAGMNNTGLDNDYTNSTTIHGSPNRIAYLPMSGRKVYTISS